MSPPRPLIAAALLLVPGLLGACGPVDLGPAPFLCHSASPRCPDGYVCNRANVCVREGSCPAGVPGCGGGTPAGRCGDGKCDRGESATSCPKDCSPLICGDGKCEAGESTATCPKDCPPKGPRCGNGKCEAPAETCATCAADCGTCPKKPICGNGKCEPPTETNATCPADCPKTGGCSPEGATRCDGTTRIRTCTGGTWQTLDCGTVCSRAGYGYAVTCRLDSAKGRDVCICGTYASFGGICQPPARRCAATLLCVSFPGSSVGFCSRRCTTAGSACPGAPAGSDARCIFQVGSPPQNVCGFQCTVYRCPSGLKCDTARGYCKP